MKLRVTYNNNVIVNKIEHSDYIFWSTCVVIMVIQRSQRAAKNDKLNTRKEMEIN